MKQTIDPKPVTSNKKSAANYVIAHGRRKEAVARIRLLAGRGGIIVNNIPIEKYFPGEVKKMLWMRPFVLTNMENKYSAIIKVEGSGKNGQLGAVIHGLSRALVGVDSKLRPTLRKAGLLTRDPRAKERRKYGRAQKARKGKQSPKR